MGFNNLSLGGYSRVYSTSFTPLVLNLNLEALNNTKALGVGVFHLLPHSSSKEQENLSGWGMCIGLVCKDIVCLPWHTAS